MSAVDHSESTAAADGPRITACIIARDEQENLPDCLASVAFCGEIVLVDSGSTDATVAIARAAGATVVEHPWRGFAAQRNVALDRARGRWILEIDADERVTPELRAEIESFTADPPPDVRLCGLPLREVFVGRALGPSAKYPKYRHRLFLRGAYRHDERRTVHEGIVPDGPVHPFRGDLLHLLAGSWSEAISDAWRYARLEAGQLTAERSAAAALKGALVRPLMKLIYRLAIDGGWRDGWAGAAKISLDCGTDSAVWIRHMTGRRGNVQGHSGVDSGQHYGAWKDRRGSVRLVAVADLESTPAAESWLVRAAREGADVALVAPEPAAGGEIRTRSLSRFGPLSVIRALDAEEQLRTIDAVVPFGRRARLALRLAPPTLRGGAPGASCGDDPLAILREIGAREAGQPA